MSDSDSSKKSSQDTSNTPLTSRRGLFKALGLGAGVIALKSAETITGALNTPAFAESDLPASNPPELMGQPLPDGLNPAHFVTHSLSPLTLESKRHLIGTSVITNHKHLFVRNNLPMPDEEIVRDRDAWQVKVEGVNKPTTLTLRELKEMGLETVTAVLQCSGNGRAFYTHGPSGSKWATGAAGCVVWSGVPVRDVVAALGGVKAGAQYLTSTGGDPLPAGLDPLSVIVERSVPREKAMADAIVAFEMNGEPIPLTHGGPVRLIVPGYFGCNQIKYVKQVAFTKEQTKAKIQHTGYRFRPIGEKGSPEQPSMWAMKTKSWLINSPAMREGTQILRGVAFGGEHKITKVEVSTNGGKTWHEAQFVGPDLGRFAWRLFTLKVSLPRGEHTLVSRAYDETGEVQPEHRPANERGYGHTGWRDHALTVNVDNAAAELLYEAQEEERRPLPTAAVSAAASASAHKTEKKALSPQAQRGREVYLKETTPQCGICHTLDDAETKGVVGPNLNELRPLEEQVLTAIKQGIGAMPPQASLSEQQLKDLARYVFEVTR